jgi:nucleotide-binding universal stress UspA family protein
MVEFDEIVVPVDGSEGSHRAARFGARLAAALGTPIKLAYVAPLTPESVMAMARMTREEIEEAQHNQAKEVLAKAQQDIGKIDAGEIILTGDAAQEILNYIDKHPKALVVMGRRGLSPVRSLLLGSVSEKVMRYAKGAVTLVN